jgi:predicted permease
VNSTIFSLVDGLWLRPPGVANARELVWLFGATKVSQSGLLSWPEFRDVQNHASSFSGVVAIGGRGARLHNASGPPELLTINVVSANFFSVMGVNALHGRVFGSGDSALLQREEVVVLGHDFWKRRFGADPSVVGRSLPLGRRDARPVRVLGVLPSSFRDLHASSDRDLWAPSETWSLWGNSSDFEPRDYRWFQVLGRLRPRMGVEPARAEMATIAAAWAERYPEHNAGRSARVVADLDYRLDTAGTTGRALAGVVMLVVLITCVNLANVLLARGARRTREIAVRAALGATRGRLIRQLLTETLVLGIAGIAAGSAVGAWLVGLLPVVLVPPPGFHSASVFEFDARVLAFTLGTSAAVVLLFGLLPAFRVARTDLARAFRADSDRSTMGVRRSRLWTGLSAGQIGVALVLLCSTATVLRSFYETQHAELGFARKPLVLASYSFGLLGQAGAIELTQRIKAVPGVKDVALAFRAPLSLSGGGWSRKVYVPESGHDPRQGLPEIRVNGVSSNFFEVTGTRILNGRAFNESDQSPGPGVAVVNEQFARVFFGGEDPVGRVIYVDGPDQPPTRIVGLARNAPVNAVTEPPQPYFYLPYWRAVNGDLTMLIEAEKDAAPVLASLNTLFRNFDNRMHPLGVTTFDALLGYSTRTQRMTAILTAILGVTGVLLTFLGVYGVVAYGVTQRRREIGIRMALGATQRATMQLVMQDGLRLLAFGICAGAPLMVYARQQLEPVLFRVPFWDVASLALAIILLVGCVVLASMVPARRAAEVNPVVALRDQ